MISGAIQLDPRLQHLAQRVRQFLPRGINDREMIQSRRTRRRRPPALALPSVQRNVMVISTRGKKCRFASHLLRDLKSKHIAIEAERALNLRHFEVHVPDSYLWMNCLQGVGTVDRHVAKDA